MGKYIYAGCAVAVTICLCLLLLDARALVKAQFGVAQRESDKTRSLINAQLDRTRGELLKEVHGQLTDLRFASQTEIRHGVDTAHVSIQEGLERVDTAVGEVHGLRTDLQPVLQNAGAITAHLDQTVLDTDKTIKDLHPQLLGLVAASKVTAGELAESSRDFQRALPSMLVTWKDIGHNVAITTDASAKASQATEHMMTNLAIATKPLPNWLRIPLSITGAIAPTAAGMLTGAAAAGAFR